MFRKTKQLRDTQQMRKEQIKAETMSTFHIQTEVRTGMWKELFASLIRFAIFGSQELSIGNSKVSPSNST
jgi:hypothetical protein